MASGGVPEKPTICLQTSLPLLQASESAEIQNAVTTLQKIYKESDTVNRQLIDEIQSLVSKVSGSRQQSSSLVSPLPVPGISSTSTRATPDITTPTTTAAPSFITPPSLPTTTAAPYVAPLVPLPTTTVAPFAPLPALNTEEEMAAANNENFSNLNLSQYGGRRRRAHTSARRNQRNRRKTVRQRR